MKNFQENHRKILALIGFARKSGNLISGTDLVIKNIKRQKLVLIACDCSQGQNEKIINACKAADVKYYMIFDKEMLSKAIGEVNRVCLGIKDSQFALSIENLIQSDSRA